jgi:hypothetical protein
MTLGLRGSRFALDMNPSAVPLDQPVRIHLTHEGSTRARILAVDEDREVLEVELVNPETRSSGPGLIPFSAVERIEPLEASGDAA